LTLTVGVYLPETAPHLQAGGAIFFVHIEVL